MIGDISAFACDIRRVSDGLAEVTGCALLPDGAKVRCGDVAAPGKGRVFVRPEEVMVGEAGAGVPASVVSTLYQGDSMLATLTLGCGEKLVARVWNEQRALAAGMDVSVQVEPRDAWVLPA
jgi:putative spermidine/putrescine transport system ATP-binding protein